MPCKIPADAQWQIYRISGYKVDLESDRKVTYRHFKPINTN